MQTRKYLPEHLSQEFIQLMREGIETKAPDWIFNLPKEPQPITQADRIEGLARIWAEARTSFAYWSNVPDLDWDAAFREYIPLVAAAEDPAAYYRLLTRFMALLREGHSYVNPPPWLQGKSLTYPKLSVRAVEGRPVVTRGEVLPLGTAITHVEGRSVADCLAEAMPYISASTNHFRFAAACAWLLRGPGDTAVPVGVEYPDGRRETVTIVRDGPLPAFPLLERVELGGGLVLCRLASFGDPRVVDLFHQAFPDFQGVTGLIFDLRGNGGGNSVYGDAIIARLVDEPVTRGAGYTPLHWGAMTAFGVPQPWLVDRDSSLEPDTARPRFRGPVAVLTSPFTGSAAEDFCATFRAARRGLLVGEPTNGSTGNPSIFMLPGGGFGAISATYVEFPGQEPFVCVGIQPDVPAAATIAGLAAGRDEVVERAIQALQQQG